MKLFVEGGEDGRKNNSAVSIRCRQAFTELLEKLRLARLPRVVACGSRKRAYDDFCTSITRPSGDGDAVLLVDSEEPVAATPPWDHVKSRVGDAWDKPAGATDDHLHFMVECMESWLIADPAALRTHFGSDLIDKHLPQAPSVETPSKRDVLANLKSATKNCERAFEKGRRAFEALAEVDPARIRAKSQWAKRFFERMEKRMGVKSS